MTTMTAPPPPTGAVFSEWEIRDLDTNGNLSKLAGRAVPYNTPADVGLFTEEFTPGAFARSIEQSARGLPLLVFHNDRGWPVGISSEWHERPDGLHGVWDLDDTPEAQFAAKRAHKGMLPYLSVKFMQDPGRYRFENRSAKPHYVRQSARLVETSLTATPVYIDSTVTWVRSMSEGQISPAVREWQAWLEKARQGLQ